MRRSKTISISEAVTDYLKEMKLDSRLREVGIIQSWETIAGKAIASRTSKIYIKDGILYVHLTSSVVRNELLMIREAIRERINKDAGAEVIKDIVFR
ncbi:MAG: DUF721 domain-containing protein [Bacteroidales bacterium]